MPRLVVPISSFPSFASPAVSSITWYGMIRCALAEIFRPEVSIRRRRRPSSSPIRTPGSITTPFPIAHVFPG